MCQIAVDKIKLALSPTLCCQITTDKTKPVLYRTYSLSCQIATKEKRKKKLTLPCIYCLYCQIETNNITKYRLLSANHVVKSCRYK